MFEHYSHITNFGCHVCSACIYGIFNYYIHNESADLFQQTISTLQNEDNLYKSDQKTQDMFDYIYNCYNFLIQMAMSLKQSLTEKKDQMKLQEELDNYVQMPIYKDASKYFVLGLLQGNQIFVSDKYFNSFKICRYISRLFRTKIIIQRHLENKIEKVAFASKKKVINIHLFEFNNIFYCLRYKKFKKKLSNECVYPTICRGDEQTEDFDRCDCCGDEHEINQLFCNSKCQHSYCVKCLIKKGDREGGCGIKKGQRFRCLLKDCPEEVNSRHAREFIDSVQSNKENQPESRSSTNSTLRRSNETRKF